MINSLLQCEKRGGASGGLGREGSRGVQKQIERMAATGSQKV